ncbi:MAG: FKBP-type peptidyl-prolyl cis-trans isomerase [Armatimonadetes bacterium]|nr:FKBP-type peptidyl-prolyl cis-trans isomerase [Armatimonadota bacterium]
MDGGLLIGLALGRPLSAPQPVVVQVLREQKGAGRAAKFGDVVTLQMVAKYDGTVVYDTEKLGMSYTFVVGKPGTVPFLSYAVLQMKPGGERLVLVDKKSTGGVAGVKGLLPAGVPLTVDLKVLAVKPGE